ncbi:hypothetical protein [Streptomyces fulvoviolaceus]|uniref:hypothetical protein n=1 Tax=Streptomyces fulvoviolaceus TaxID=285535 RepID=UPI0021BEF73D|nr:hypothetical protein [Streptomyces fulvoviolaceus]MCT9078343.1 hypothetical protein [Streptomyces fulvoviolaceus]
MTARPSRPVRLLASALAAGTLLTTAACSSDDGDNGSSTAEVAASPVAKKSPTASPAAVLTEAGARTALITEADIEDDWTQVKDAATWRDSLLIDTVDVADFLTAKTDAADCQKLLDALYGDDLLGEPSGASALRGFEEDQSRLLHQVAAYGRAELAASLTWLKTLPVKCDQFTATDSAGEQRTVRVIEASLPDAGDARQGLRVTVQGKAATLTLDVAAVRVGTDAITVTAGGLDGDEGDSVEDAVKLGTQRLKDVLAGRTPAATPGEVD